MHRGKKLSETEAALRSKYSEYKKNAKKRGIGFDLSLEFFFSIMKKNCFYCGQEPSILARSKHGDTTLCGGIDRMDSSFGYISRNCVPCCSSCNKAKSTMGVQEFMEWVERVYNFMRGGKS